MAVFIAADMCAMVILIVAGVGEGDGRREPAEAGDGGVHCSRDHLMLVGAGAGGLHRSRGGFMLVMHGDGVLTRGRHVRDAAGASDGRQRQPRQPAESC